MRFDDAGYPLSEFSTRILGTGDMRSAVRYAKACAKNRTDHEWVVVHGHGGYRLLRADHWHDERDRGPITLASVVFSTASTHPAIRH